MRIVRPTILVSILLLVLISGCSTTVPATVTMETRSPLPLNASIFLTATRQLSRIEQSLHDAGLRTTRTASDADYELQVNVGSTRGSQPCGATNNVAYIVSANGIRVMIIKGRGPTGSCDRNVFDDMSQKLASYGGR